MERGAIVVARAKDVHRHLFDEAAVVELAQAFGRAPCSTAWPRVLLRSLDRRAPVSTSDRQKHPRPRPIRDVGADVSSVELVSLVHHIGDAILHA